VVCFAVLDSLHPTLSLSIVGGAMPAQARVEHDEAEHDTNHLQLRQPQFGERKRKTK
jgi:hypothetical protein